jgi:type IV secretory pathway VirB4 component
MATPLKQEAGNSQDLVDIKEIRGNVVMLKDGSLRQIVMVGGVNFALKSETEQNLMIQAYQSFLNGVDFPLQILVHSRKVNIDDYLATLLKRKESESSPLLQNQIEEYVAFIKGFIEKNAIMEKTFLMVIPFYPMANIAGASKTVSGFFPSFGKKAAPKAADPAADEEIERTFKEIVAQLNQRTSQVINGIGGIGLDVTILENEELIELFYNFYNPQTVEREKINVSSVAPAEAGAHALEN